MTPDSGEKDLGGCWADPRLEPWSETVWFYCLGPWLVGASDANGVGTSVGVSWWLLGGASVGASVGDSAGLLVGASVGQSLGRKRRQDISSFFFGDSVGQTASGRWSGYRSESLGQERCRGVGQDLVGESVGRTVSGRRSVWGALVKHGIGTSVGICFATAWVKRIWDVGRAIGWRQRRGSIGRGLGQRQRGSIGRSLGERRLWRINYSCMKKSAMVDDNNYVS